MDGNTDNCSMNVLNANECGPSHPLRYAMLSGGCLMLDRTAEAAG
jgi:hypothetical protein